MDPIAATGWSSKIGMNVVPPSVDFQTPPDADPRYQVLGSPGTPATAAIRPADAGPMYLNLSGSGVEACCGPCGPPRCAKAAPGASADKNAMKDSIRHEEVVMSGQYSKLEAGVWRLEVGVGSEVAIRDLTATHVNDLRK
jgi:hypothetical protein